MEQLEECDQNLENEISLFVQDVKTKDSAKLVCIFKRLPAGIYLLKVNNRNTRTRCVICSKLTIKTPERRH